MILLLLSIISSACLAQNQRPPVTALHGKIITAGQLDRKIDSLLSLHTIPGLSLAIINDSALVYHNTFGVINTATNQAVNAKTLFEGASLSKPIFAYFALKMVEEGIIELDRPLCHYLLHPEIADNSFVAYQKVSARMVLSHSSGFPNHAQGKEINLAFEPGTEFRYSGEGYQYLAEVIAAQKQVDTGHELNALFQSYVFRPLHMKSSTFVGNAHLVSNKAFGHNKSNEPTAQNSQNNAEASKFYAYSSLHSEALDYAQFLTALIKQEGLHRESFEEIFKEQTPFKENNPLKQEIGQTGWGLGMAQKPSKYGLMHMHTGNNHDFQSYMMILPEKGFGIVFFINCGNAIPFIQSLNALIGPVF